MPGANATLPAVMTFAEWKKGTARTLHTRSRELKAVDVALEQYEHTPSAMRFARVKEAFGAWKKSKGPGDAWKGSARDQNQIITLLDQQLRGVGDTDVAGGAQAFMEPALINSRLGALYLFGHMDCDDSVFKVALHGAIDLTTASLDYAGGDSNVAMGQASSALGKGKDAAGKGADFVENKIRAASAGGGTVTSQQLLGGNVVPPTDGRMRQIWESIKATLYEYAQKIWDAIRAQLAGAKQKFADLLSDPAASALAVLPGMLRKLCDLLAGKFLAAAAPFIGAGLDLAKGLANTIDSGVTKFKEWLSGRDVVLLAGHPGTIVQAIRRAMWFSVGEGLYDTVKGGLKLGLEFASSGASVIGALIVSIVEALVTTIWRVIEIIRMRGFFKQAAQYWQVRGEAGALHTRPIAFNNWFKGYAVDMPALSVLALNSGVCGDKMHFLKMYSDDTSVIPQSAFDQGCKYVDELKVWGSKFLGDAGFSFSSQDPVVSGLLKLAQSHTKETGKGAKAWNAALGFLNA
ncbi:MAG: hypothetical protein OEY03_14315 [Rhizobacter sp.]|nr:hypothetical protein [Rhizobacter sp.]